MSSSESDSDTSEGQFEDEQEEDDSDGSDNDGVEDSDDISDEDLPFPISVNSDGSEDSGDEDEDDSDEEDEDDSDNGELEDQESEGESKESDKLHDDETGGELDDENESDNESRDDSEDDDAVKSMKNLVKKQTTVQKKEKQAILQKASDGNSKKLLENESPKTNAKEKKPKLEIKSKKSIAVQSAKKVKDSKSKAYNKLESLKAKDPTKKVPFNQNKENIQEKYEKRRGKSLYIRFPKRLPMEAEQIKATLKELCPLVMEVRRPRQPSTRFCLVDFRSEEDCKKACKELRKAMVDGKRLVVHIPKTDSPNFLEDIVKKRRKKLAENRAKKKLAKSVKQAKERAPKKDKVFTSTIVISDIPVNASAEDIKCHFPDAMEFKLLYAKGTRETNSAVVTLPTPKDASVARQKTILIGEKKLAISFAGQPQKKKGDKAQKLTKGNAKQSDGSAQRQEVQSANSKNKGKNKRKANASPQKRIKVEVDSSPVKKIKVEKEIAGSEKPNQLQSEKIKKEVKTEPHHQPFTNKLKTGDDSNASNQKQKKRKQERVPGDDPALKKIKGTIGLSSDKSKKNPQNVGPGKKGKKKPPKINPVPKKLKGIEGLENKGKPGKFAQKTWKFSNRDGNKGKDEPNKGKSHKEFRRDKSNFNSKKGEFGGRKNFNKKGNFHMKSMRP